MHLYLNLQILLCGFIVNAYNPRRLLSSGVLGRSVEDITAQLYNISYNDPAKSFMRQLQFDKNFRDLVIRKHNNNGQSIQLPVWRHQPTVWIFEVDTNQNDINDIPKYCITEKNRQTLEWSTICHEIKSKQSIVEIPINHKHSTTVSIKFIYCDLFDNELLLKVKNFYLKL